MNENLRMILENDLDANIEKLTQRVIRLYHEKEDSNQRLIVSVAGVPGSGKSTITAKVCKSLNKMLGLQIATVLPQDGFHYYRKELMDMRNPEALIKRRGAPFTFNSSRLLELVKQVKKDGNTTIFVPSFDHELKDPQENSIEISPLMKIVLLEGNYVHLKDDGWRELHSLSDEKWLILADLNIIKQRLVQRHILAGICTSIDESVDRVESNDLINANYIIDHSIQPDVIFMNQ
ncbi:unnamed protein product [Debaryomyces fabryi]|nr:unnamed protein product [Debaryomyces fabryi]